MTIMNTELYEALKEAGASDEKAKAASNVVEEQNKRFDGLEHNISDFRKDIDHKFEMVDHKFEMMTRDLKITIGGYFIVAVGVILAAMKFMQ